MGSMPKAWNSNTRSAWRGWSTLFTARPTGLSLRRSSAAMRSSSGSRPA